MRPCCCDWDVRVFGHAYCWTTHLGAYGQHITCTCTRCDCHCHKDRPWPPGGSSPAAPSSAA